MTTAGILEGFNAGAARVAMTGAVRVAPLGTAMVPITGKYTDAHRNLGSTSPDGVEISFDEDKQEYIPWQEASAIRVDITKAVKAIKLTLWETGPGQLAKFLGVPQSELEQLADGGVAFWEGGLPNFEHEQLHIDMVDGSKHNRVSFPDAQISERGALVLKKDDIFGLELTYTTFPGGPAYAGTPARGKTAYWQFNADWVEAAETSSSADGVAPLRVTTADLPDAQVGVEYTAALAATGGTEPYTWEVTTGTLPDGLTLAADGTLSGTPTTEDIVEVTVKVTDKGQLLASKQLTINVNAA